MTKTESIGIVSDLHGYDIWKKFVNENPQIEKWVFLGDYCDSFTHKNEAIWNNLADIIAFKKANPDMVELLLGNHDIHYIFDGKYRCSGFRAESLYGLKILFEDNKDLFNVAYQKENYLFTHAGVSNSWFNKHRDVLHKYHSQFSPNEIKCLPNGKFIKTKFTLADLLNTLYKTHDSHILMEVGQARGGSADNYGGIFWACKSETKEDYLDGCNQIVGHTAVDEITVLAYKDSSITYTDCLGTKEEFLTLEI